MVSPGSSLLFSYTAGGSLSGATVTRSTTATQNDNTGAVQTAAINVARDAHYIAGIRTLLEEGQRTNSALWSSDYSQGAWTKVTATLTAGIADPSGGTTATTFAATGAAADVYQQVTMSAGTDVGSIWIRRRTGTGLVKLIDPAGARITVTITGSWARYSASAVGGINPFVGVELATSGDAVDIWGGQIEAGAFATSYIPTTTVAVTRSTDSHSFAGVSAIGATLFQRYYDLATSAWVDAVSAYTSGAAIALTVYRAYQTVAVLRGTYSASQAAAILGVP